MTVFFNTYFNKIFWFTCLAAFIVICLRAFFIPFSHDEAATFFYYVQSDNYLPYKAHVYTNNHFLNSALANIFYHFGGSHRFVLRLPNVLSFICLCLGIYRHFAYLNNVSSKAILAGFFLLTFNFLDFFELCRGYGLSIGFLLLSLSYLIDYFKANNLKSLVIFSLFLQLALAANLILVVAATILLFSIYLYQIKMRIFFTIKNSILQLINLALLFFWIKFSFFYKEHGSLDYGVGENYWEVTFKTLLLFLYGTDALWLQILTVLGFVSTLLFTAYSLLKQRTFNHIFSTGIYYSLVLIVVVLAFYLQKQILEVNFPEDRTGIFFFVFFVLSISFFVDHFKFLSKIFVPAIILALFIVFIFSANLSDFTSPFYHTMPKKLYEQLKDEYSADRKLFTIGGHRVRELNYTFLNYRGESMLNSMDDAEEMQMNCDYYFAMNCEKPFYSPFYNEIGFDKKWDRVLLKRKEQIKRTDFYINKDLNFNGTDEFYGIKQISDTTFKNINPLELTLEIEFINVPKPLNAFIVLEIRNEKGEKIHYKRVPLNWLSKDLNGKKKYMKLTSGNLEKKVTVVAYLWNIQKQNINISIKHISLSTLFGNGVTYKIPAEFYTLIYNINKKPLL